MFFKKIDAYEVARKNKVAIIIAAILFFIIGVLCVISPFEAGAVLVWIMIGLVGIASLACIFRFIFPKKGEERNGSSFFLGLLLLLCSVGLILIGCLGKGEVFKGVQYTSMEVTTIRLLGFGSIFFGVLAVLNNIFLLCNVGNISECPRGLIVTRAVIGLIVGVLMIIFPFVMFTISILIGGIYLIIVSIAAIVFVCKVSKNKINE